MRNFRQIAFITVTIFSVILAFAILNYRVPKYGLWFVIVLFVFILAITSFFASIHPSAAEGIQTSFIVENHLSGGYDYMQHCIPVTIALFSPSEESFILCHELSESMGNAVDDLICLIYKAYLIILSSFTITIITKQYGKD